MYNDYPTAVIITIAVIIDYFIDVINHALKQAGLIFRKHFRLLGLKRLKYTF